MAKGLSRRFERVISVIKSLSWRNIFRRKHRHREPFVYDTDGDAPIHNRDTGVFEPWERYATVADLCTRVRGPLPVQVVKLIARDVLRELENLHEAQGIAHNDINVGNILLSPRDMRALLSQLHADTQTSLQLSEISFDPVLRDFNSMLTSNSSPVFYLSSAADLDNFGLRGLSENYSSRTPEDLIGAPQGTSADLWILGCILYELLAGESLFDPFFQTAELGLSLEESHLIQIIELLGQFPRDLLGAGEHSDRWFTEDGSLRIDTTYYPSSLETILSSRVDAGELANTTAFLGTLLQLHPRDRAKAQDIIRHPWFNTS